MFTLKSIYMFECCFSVSLSGEEDEEYLGLFLKYAGALCVLESLKLSTFLVIKSYRLIGEGSKIAGCSDLSCSLVLFNEYYYRD